MFANAPEFTPVTQTNVSTHIATEIAPYVADRETYIEPLASQRTLLGGKNPHRNELINDHAEDLVTLYDVLYGRPDELASFLHHTLVDSAVLSEWTQLYRRGYRHGTPLVQAAQYCAIHWGTHLFTDDSQTVADIEDQLLSIRDRLDEVVIKSTTPKSLLTKYDTGAVVYFCDLPLEGTVCEYHEGSWDAMRILQYLTEWDAAGTCPYWVLACREVPGPLEPFYTVSIDDVTTLVMNYDPENVETATTPDTGTTSLESFAQ